MNRDTFDPGPLVDVDCEPGDDRWTLVFVRDLRHPPQKVWAALTQPAQLRQWSPYTADRDLGGVGDATATMIDGAESMELALSVRQAKPPVLLEYTLGTDLLRWDLVGTREGTRLTLRHTVQSRDWMPKVAAGWHLCLLVAERLLDGDPIGPIVGSDAHNYGWDELHDRYAEKLGVTGGGLPDDQGLGRLKTAD